MLNLIQEEKKEIMEADKVVLTNKRKGTLFNGILSWLWKQVSAD